MKFAVPLHIPMILCTSFLRRASGVILIESGTGCSLGASTESLKAIHYGFRCLGLWLPLYRWVCRLDFGTWCRCWSTVVHYFPTNSIMSPSRFDYSVGCFKQPRFAAVSCPAARSLWFGYGLVLAAVSSSGESLCTSARFSTQQVIVWFLELNQILRLMASYFTIYLVMVSKK